MSNIKGTIQSVSCKEGNDHPKYGMSYQTSVKIDGEWYGAFTKKTADELGLEKGKLVSLTWTQNGKYKNFDPKSLSVAEREEAPAASTPSAKPASATTGTRWAGEVGTTVGHAINNAVQLAIANKTTDLKSIHGLAVDIITLHRKLSGQYELIVKRAEKLIAEATAKRKTEAAEPEQEAEQQEEAPAPKPKAKPAVTAKKPAPKKVETPPESDPDDPGPQEPETAPEFDDDIPF